MTDLRKTVNVVKNQQRRMASSAIQEFKLLDASCLRLQESSSPRTSRYVFWVSADHWSLSLGRKWQRSTDEGVDWMVTAMGAMWVSFSLTFTTMA